MRIASRAAALISLTILSASPAYANKLLIPAFARKYNISCSVCHAPVPKLTPAGEAFAGNGFEFEVGEEPRDTIATGDPTLRLQRALPLAVRFDAYANLYSNAPKGSASNDLQTPWVMKLLSGGQIADKMSYYMYFLLTERGEVAGLEDAYVQFTNVGGSPLSLIVGQFQVSDPLFKRELRLTYDDYQAYRVRVGNAKADLTYDRGVMAVWSPWEGADMAASVVSGRGLNQADDERKYDSDSDKNFAFRYSQEIGHLRLGGYVYGGNERQLGRNNRITIFGPDATLSLTSKVELNLQYVTRKDDDPFYGACSVSAPCAGTRTKPFGTTVRSGFVEATISPQGPAGKMFFSGLYNWASSDDQVISLRLGEQGTPPGLLSEYRTASFAVHRMHHRNVRMTAEAQWDFTNERARLLTGFVVGF